MKCCLLGETLKHSYSKEIHGYLGDYSYDLTELKGCELNQFVKTSSFDGYNVTIPFKRVIMPLLDEVDGSAKEVGAVNTVVKGKDGKTKGYNTDVFGFLYLAKYNGIALKDKAVVVLGSGGTSNTVCYALKKVGAKKITVVSRNGEYNYKNIEELKDTQVIVNTTPVGMYPNLFDGFDFNLTAFPLLESVLDVIYNPLKTLLIECAKTLGKKTANGLMMLVAQAVKASDLWQNKETDERVIETVYKKMLFAKRNIVLTGMAGAGKSAVANLLSQILGKAVIDTDLEIEKRLNKTIPQIFESQGETFFREEESKVIMETSLLNGRIISTGGGVIKNKDNITALKKNGVVVFIDRDIGDLETSGRPLYKDKEAVAKIFEERYNVYKETADIIVKNDSDLKTVAEKIIKEVESL